jgi:membrane protein DedA with SNARE-associated domain
VASAAVPKLELASRALIWASVLIPIGFFLGGTVTYEADPGVGVFLVPFGALALLIALTRVVWVLVRTRK